MCGASGGTRRPRDAPAAGADDVQVQPGRSRPGRGAQPGVVAAEAVRRRGRGRVMRVRVMYTVTVDDRYRRAINYHYGRPGLASRVEVRSWLRENGRQGDDDLINDMDQTIKCG